METHDWKPQYWMGKSIVSNHPNVHPNSRCKLLFSPKQSVSSGFQVHFPHVQRLIVDSTGFESRLTRRLPAAGQPPAPAPGYQIAYGCEVVGGLKVGVVWFWPALPWVYLKVCENWEVHHFEDSGLWLRDSIWCFFFASILLATLWETLYFETSQKNVPIDISLHQLRLRSGRRWTIALCARSDDPLWLQNGPPEFRQGGGMLQHTILRRQCQAARVKNL